MIRLILLLLLVSPLVNAKGADVPQKEQLTTDMRFNGLKVNGKYNTPGETSIVAEDDKELNNLISIRKHFRDRIREEMRRN